MAGKLSLLNESSDDSEVEFKINKNYANRYDNWRKLEEMQKLKDLSKDVSDSSSSDEEIEPVMEKDFFRTLSLIKGKDPRVYDKEYQFFKDEEAPKREPKPKKEKPMLMKQYNRQVILERNGEVTDEEEEQPPPFMTRDEEEEELKNSFKAALQDSDDDDEEDLLQVREKSKVEVKKEEDDYKHWLETDEDMKHLNQVWSDPNLDANEKFLRDYFLKEWFLEKNKDEIPTHEEIVGDATTLSEDERILDEQEKFEHKYNFRFEEPGEEFIQRYPRNTGDSLRSTNTKRKQKREEYAERKRKEKELKREELKRLKALKRKEIEEMFSKLKEVSGKDELNFDPSDIESDFDPDKHDRKMRELFDDDYYTVEETQKPEFEHDEEIDDEQWDKWQREPQNRNEDDKDGDADDENENEDDLNQENHKDQHRSNNKEDFAREMIGSTSGRKKRAQKKSLFAKIISQPKPLYDPSGKSFEEYLEDYYKLDYEDIIGDQPVRYKYRKVIPNDFGLTVDEILAANDKELNQWCSIKKTCQYRKDEEEMRDFHAFKRKGQNMKTKRIVLPSVYAPPKEEEEEEVIKPNETKKKRNKKKKNKAVKSVDGAADHEQHGTIQKDEGELTTEEESKLQSKKKKKHSRTDDGEMNGTNQGSEFLNEVEASNKDLPNNETTESRINKSKRKRKRRKPKSATLSESNSLISAENVNNECYQSEPNEVTNDLLDNGDICENPIDSLIKSYKNAKVLPNSDSNSTSVHDSRNVTLIDTNDLEESSEIKSSNKRKRKKPKVESIEESLSTESIPENVIEEPTTALKKKKKRKSAEISMPDDIAQPNSKKSWKVESAVENPTNESISESEPSAVLKRKKKRKSTEESVPDDTAQPNGKSWKVGSVEENLTNESISGNEPNTVLKKKKKRKSTEELMPDVLVEPKSKKLKKDSDSESHQHTNDTNDENKTEEAAEKPKRKRMRKRLKKKKKKKKPDDRYRKPRNFVQMKTPQTDKRLALSDDRLAAFGFNPKRFKHGIIFGNQ